MGKPIYSITPFTLLDFPDRTACILWFAGCNMRCLYCYNPDIVTGKGKYEETDVFRFLNKRVGLLDGVVFSGGECTLHPEIFNFAAKIKKLGMLVKIDTNASRPHMLGRLIKARLVDYVSVDFKATNLNYQNVTGTQFYELFLNTLELLMKWDVPFEVRTTVHSLLTSPEELEEMHCTLRSAGYRGKYYIQHYVGHTPTLGQIEDSDLSIYSKVIESCQKDMVWRNAYQI